MRFVAFGGVENPQHAIGYDESGYEFCNFECDDPNRFCDENVIDAATRSYAFHVQNVGRREYEANPGNYSHLTCVTVEQHNRKCYTSYALGGYPHFYDGDPYTLQLPSNISKVNNYSYGAADYLYWQCYLVRYGSSEGWYSEHAVTCFAPLGEEDTECSATNTYPGDNEYGLYRGGCSPGYYRYGDSGYKQWYCVGDDSAPEDLDDISPDNPYRTVTEIISCNCSEPDCCDESIFCSTDDGNLSKRRRDCSVAVRQECDFGCVEYPRRLGLVRECHECSEDKDCNGSDRCVIARNGPNLCQAIECSEHSDCAEKEHCSDGRCDICGDFDSEKELGCDGNTVVEQCRYTGYVFVNDNGDVVREGCQQGMVCSDGACVADTSCGTCTCTLSTSDAATDGTCSISGNSCTTSDECPTGGGTPPPTPLGPTQTPCTSHSDCGDAEYCSACGQQGTYNSCSGSGVCELCTWVAYCNSDDHAKKRCEDGDGDGRKYELVEACSDGQCAVSCGWTPRHVCSGVSCGTRVTQTCGPSGCAGTYNRNNNTQASPGDTRSWNCRDQGNPNSCTP